VGAASREGRENAEGLGRWARSGIAVIGGGSSPDSLPEAADCVKPLEARDVFPAPDVAAVGVASDAATRSLSSWYFSRPSSGRTPFSM